MRYPPTVKYPHFLIEAEKWLGDTRQRWSPIPTPLAERLQNWLATRRLNSVVPGLLQSVWMQAYGGSFRVTVEKKEGESQKDHDLRRLAAQADHAVGALVTIQLFVYRELRQRGLLHLIEHERVEEPPVRRAGKVTKVPEGQPWTPPRATDGHRPTRVLFVDLGYPASPPERAHSDYLLYGTRVTRDREGHFSGRGQVTRDEMLNELVRHYDEIEVRHIGAAGSLGTTRRIGRRL